MNRDPDTGRFIQAVALATNDEDFLDQHADYLNPLVYDFNETIENAAKRLKSDASPFDTLVGTGLSGALIVPALAARLGVAWAVIRKPEDTDNHSWLRLEGRIGKRWIFVDDLIASGSTRERVQDEVRSATTAAQHTAEYVGDYMYLRGYFNPAPTRQQIEETDRLTSYYRESLKAIVRGSIIEEGAPEHEHGLPKPWIESNVNQPISDEALAVVADLKAERTPWFS